MYRLGRLLQVVGMLMLPLAIAANLSPDNPIDLWTSLKFSGLGVVVFVVGWMLQQRGAPPG